MTNETNKSKPCPKCEKLMGYDYEGSSEWYQCNCGYREYVAMTPEQALEVIGKIWLEIPGHPWLQVCESIPQVQKAMQVLYKAIDELKELKAEKK